MELNEQRRSNILQDSDNLYLYDQDVSIPLTVGIKRAYSITSNRVDLVSQLERVHTYIFLDGNQTDVLQVLSEKTRLKL